MAATIPADLLEILRCPVTRQRLVPADPGQLARLNARIAAGEPRAEPLEAALVRADGTTAYPVRGGIPILLAEESVTFS